MKHLIQKKKGSARVGAGSLRNEKTLEGDLGGHRRLFVQYRRGKEVRNGGCDLTN